VTVPEAPLERSEHGLVPAGEGWYVLNAREAEWGDDGELGVYAKLESPQARFPQLGFNVAVVEPGQPMCMYHYEADQEDFLIVAGEALLIVEGEERPLRRWDFVHCPPNTRHVIVGAGEGPTVIVAVGARIDSTGDDWGAYPVDEAALRHGAGVEVETTDPEEAYARFDRRGSVRYEGWLPDL
jgi:uncharacterized cupin superfamily protein